MESNRTSGRPHLVALPYPGRGHINPMMNLCCHLAPRGLTITFIVTEEWVGLLSASSPPPPPGVRLLSIPNVLPSEKSRAANMSAFFTAILTEMEGPVHELVEGLDPQADAVVADSLLQWAPEVGRRRGIPVSSFFTMAATVFLALQHLNDDDDGVDCAGQVPAADMPADRGAARWLDYLPESSSSTLADFLSGRNILSALKQSISWFSAAQALLIASSYDLESHAVDALRSEFSLPILPIGPSVPQPPILEPTDPSYQPHYEWLDGQPENSVLYLSLGSHLSTSAEQTEEIAAGLKLSGVRFLWVAREELGGVGEMAAGGVGLVVPWCDQFRVLCHPSVGGFLTHCGWNSVLEAVCAGVPMLALPLMWDQHPNSRLVVDDWRVGFRLECAKGGGVAGREDIAEAVKKLMDLNGEESREMRSRVGKLKGMCSRALEEKGSSSANLDAFAQYVGRERDCEQNGCS